MGFENNMIESLIKEVDFLMDSEASQFTVVEEPRVESISKRGKADEGAALLNEKWIPKSQLRVNGDNELVCASWIHDQEFGKGVTT